MRTAKEITVLLIMTALPFCTKPLESNCGGQDYLIPSPVTISATNGRVRLGDTIFLYYSLPLQATNLATGGLTADLSRFRRFSIATSVIRYDTASAQPLRLSTANGKSDFNYSSPHTTVSIMNQRDNDPTFRFFLIRRGDSMIASIRIMPRRKGIFAFVLGQGIIEDAICRADLDLRFASGSIASDMENFRNFTGVRAGDAFGRPELSDDALGSERSRFIFVY